MSMGSRQEGSSCWLCPFSSWSWSSFCPSSSCLHPWPSPSFSYLCPYPSAERNRRQSAWREEPPSSPHPSTDPPVDRGLPCSSVVAITVPHNHTQINDPKKCIILVTLSPWADYPGKASNRATGKCLNYSKFALASRKKGPILAPNREPEFRASFLS